MSDKQTAINELIEKHRKELDHGVPTIPIAELMPVLDCKKVLIVQIDALDEMAEQLKQAIHDVSPRTAVVATTGVYMGTRELPRSGIRMHMEDIGLTGNDIFKMDISFLIADGEIRLLRHAAFPTVTKFTL